MESATTETETWKVQGVQRDRIEDKRREAGREMVSVQGPEERRGGWKGGLWQTWANIGAYGKTRTAATHTRWGASKKRRDEQTCWWVWINRDRS
jgi:hypothetical protein